MLATVANTLPVGLGELQVSADGELVAYSLGSCVAICLYDPRQRVAAMAHVVLPDSAAMPRGTPGKFADTAVPALLEAVQRLGGVRFRLRCHIAGGAAVLALGGGGKLPSIGQRNIEAVRAALTRAGLRILGEATGGTQGRTVRLDSATGRVTVRTVGGEEKPL